MIDLLEKAQGILRCELHGKDARIRDRRPIFLLESLTIDGVLSLILLVIHCYNSI